MIITPRRPLDDDKPNGYQESDKDYVLNNIAACVMLLDRELQRTAISSEPEHRDIDTPMRQDQDREDWEERKKYDDCY